MRFAHLAQKLFNTPLAITPDKAEIVMAALADRLGIAQLFRADGSQAALTPAFLGDEGMGGDGDNFAGYDTVAGVAVIPVRGTLVQRTGSLRPYSGMTGYDGLRMAFLSALADDDIDAIALDIDSPGGEVAGCFDLVDTIFDARGRKPIVAVLNEAAYSAAYAIASAADRIAVPRTGGVGSIGVIAMHVDLSKALSGAGIAVTVVAHGDRKADFNEAKPLSKDAKAWLQADVDATALLFNDTVARNRGLRADDIEALQAGIFRGADGVARGLADAVLAPDAAFRELLATLD